MPLLVIPFPDIDPVLIEIGPFAIRWYALAYIGGLLIGWRYMVRLSRRPGAPIDEAHIDDLLFWITLGVVLGGRLGYVLFYNPAYYLAHPVEALMVWRGGMSFHGGLLGVAVASVWFAKRRGLAALSIGDLIGCTAPIGIFLGRLANFINGELYGRPSELPWAMIFPTGGDQPRHPSQLYEALLEGLVLFVVLWLLARKAPSAKRPGFLFGAFCAGYALARAFVELFRQPDAHIGFLAGGATMGQLLSLPLLLAGIYLMARTRRAP
jgi:phosphatidylglycerol:prolipoprotein diacylglycerol transferase